MPRGGRKGGGGRGRGKGKSDHPPPEHKDSASDGAASSDDQTKTAAASSDKTKTSSQNKAKVKSAKAARKPRPENAESQRDEMSDIQSDPSHSPIPPPRSPTARPPSKAKKFTANKPDRHSAKLTEAQQDTMFEWLEQTPAIYDTNHVDYKRRIQLFGEQAVAMGDGLDGATLELWFKSCRTVISKCKTRKSGTNWTPLTHGTPNEKRLWTKMSWLVPFIKPPRRHNLKSVSIKII